MSKAIRPGDPPPTEKQIDTICVWISKGVLLDTALARAGVPRTLFNRWLRAGAENLEPYATYAARVESSLLLFECKLIEAIEGQVGKNLAAATWLFQLRFGPKYKRAAEQEAGLEANTPMAPQAQQDISEEDLEAAERRALEAQKHVEAQKPRALKFGLEEPKTKH